MSTILLVDDDFAILEGLALLLEGEGYRVRKAVDGAEALARLLEEPVDLVLCDVMMPVLSGPALLAAMSAEPRLSAIPVVLMTAARAYTPPDNAQCVAVVAKPFLLDALLALLEQALAGRARGG